MAATEVELFAKLAELGIETTTVRHPPVFTVNEAKTHRGVLPGGHTKNLFLKDKKDGLWLVVALEDRKIDLKWLQRELGAGRLSFGSAALLREVLGVEPGSVTPFSLINDGTGRVQAVLDQSMLEAEVVYYHPLVNSATTAIAPNDLLRFLDACGHPPRIMRFSEPVP
ncbi:MAG: prolyl-tRNA synthetase associated domain-containing protein [Hyphomicrobiales bacterium]|nr:prolyl-tRNA synthetase associated domain-containing protein [Hyphomicrobiales bacterium]